MFSRLPSRPCERQLTQWSGHLNDGFVGAPSGSKWPIVRIEHRAGKPPLKPKDIWAIVVQRKTQRPVQFELTEPTKAAVTAWIEKAKLKPERCLFPSRIATSPHVSTRLYARIVHQWVAAIGLDLTVYGTHTMRRTKATLIYERTKNLRAVQILLGHTQTGKYRSIPGHRGRRRA